MGTLKSEKAIENIKDALRDLVPFFFFLFIYFLFI